MLSKEQVISKRRAQEKENKKYGRTIDDNRYSKSNGERFTQAQYTQMNLAEELVKGYEEGTLSSEDALRKLNALGYKTGINTDNALERLEKLIPEIREYATSVSRGLYSPHIKALIDLFLVEDADATSSAEKPLDTTELGALNQILHHMNFVFENYGKIWRGGRWVIKRLSQIAIALNL